MSENVPRGYQLIRHTGDPFDTVSILLVSIITLIVALAWRDFATTVFDSYFPDDQDRRAPLFWYALIATIVAIVVIWCIVKCLNRKKTLV